MSVFEFAKSTISRAIGSAAGPALPFSIGEPISSSPSSLWAIHRGTKKDDNTPVSVFVFDCARFKDKVAIARNCLKRFKTIRHPDILKFIDGVETDSQIIIGTEAVEPLSSQLAESSNENMTAWGLFKIGRAIKFLNTDCSIIHANVRIDSIFVTKAGEWKLGGLELLCSLKEERPFVVDYGNSLPDSSKYIPPEFRNGSWSMVKSIPVWAIDSWQYGCLLYEIFNQPFSRPEELAKKGAIPQSLALAYKGLLNSDPRSRMDIETVLERGDRQGGYFDNDFVKVSIFLEQIAMKDAHEKDQFLRKIDASIDTFPTDFCKYKILPELINALEFGGAGAKALTPILKIGSKMTHEEFDSLITPIIVRLFSSNDRSIRSSLCENLGHFVEHLSTKVVNDKIFPNLATGFGDTSALIRELTLKSILLIIGKLSERVINNDLLRYLAKLQTDEEPGIRTVGLCTNTTICLGKISKHLSDSTRKKILIPAFTRSLHDPFPPSRNAGLLALAATQDYYDATDIALKVLPHMSPLLVDNERNIREQAFKAFDVFIKKLEAHSKSMPEPQAPAVSPAAQVPSATAPAATSNPAQAGPASSPADSWSSWSAVSVLSSKLTNTIIGSAGAPATPTPGSGIGAPPSAGPAGQARPVALDRAASASPQIRTNPPTQYGANNASASRPAASNGQSSSSKPTAGDGWNDDDTGGWDVDEEADYDDGWGGCQSSCEWTRWYLMVLSTSVAAGAA
ncbi:armadillo-type protein [Polychytrium aggregatum]|uniref:armadillo-type protein n=1 Tax=Polychytrium aggregatum TaxID=110093 RepID=UPI0022FEB900|nr:armadillo-type protein [Polychytrium aggregatum]KAI9197249.1 armadillo-type protein [Polychytrium aggregatum]